MQDALSYYRQNLKNDLPAGLVVFLVALPLCLGISLASGAPLFSGIITGIIGGLVVSLLSGSSLSVSGPAAGLTVIVAEAIYELKTFEAFLLAGFIAGILQLVLGYAKAGIIGMYFPSSVIRGMLAAIGLTLIIKQIPHFLGVPGEADLGEKHGLGAFLGIFQAFKYLTPGATLIGVISLLFLIAWDTPARKKIKAFDLVPGALVVVFLAVGLNALFSLVAPGLMVAKEHLVNLPVFSSPSQIVGELKFPDWSQLGNKAIYITAITIAIIASLETLLSVEAVDKLDPLKRNTPSNRELKAQGVGNILCCLIGGLPLTAVIVRSSANVGAGGRTRVSSFVHGVLLLVSALFLARLINLIPLSALAAVLLVVGFKLTTPVLWKSQWKLGWDQFIPFASTIVAVLATDLLIGVAFGLAIGIFFVLKAHYKLPFLKERHTHLDSDTLRIQLAQNVTFLNKASLVAELSQVPERSNVTIDGSKSDFIDYDVLEAIQHFKNTSEHKLINVHLIDIPSVATVGGH
ncbi:SulP family inorganic anion transporter [bacterium]|nr:MAG: SulP family inorganic anion transporter [bacterium]